MCNVRAGPLVRFHFCIDIDISHKRLTIKITATIVCVVLHRVCSNNNVKRYTSYTVILFLTSDIITFFYVILKRDT
jgi:hypothetical protein